MNEENKISVKDFLDRNDLLQIAYIPFTVKLQTVMAIIQSVVNDIGYLNSSVLRRIAIETFINVITNIDMELECDNGLRGYDYLSYSDSFDLLISHLGNQYHELYQMLDEQVKDYENGKFEVKKNEG